jgi:DNA replication protein DnaC
MPVISDDERRRHAEEREQRERDTEIARCWHEVATDMGRRYHDCRIDNFEFHGTAEEQARQKDVIRKCSDYADDIVNRVASGVGIVLFGPPGSGKDHIMAALIKRAIDCGLKVKWINGLDFFGNMRDSMDSETTEESIFRHLATPAVLAISDPLPPWGPLTTFQSQTMFRLIDRRYRKEKPIWVTANFADGNEAADRIGLAVQDRLRDRAMALQCDWKSYRKTV